MRLADTNRRKAAILNGLLIGVGDASAVSMVPLGLGAASTLVHEDAAPDAGEQSPATVRELPCKDRSRLHTYGGGGDVNPCDEQRFTALYREHHPAVDAYVRRRLGGSPASDDVVAEVFLTAWRRLDEIPRRAVLPWLYATARRTLANAYRAERRRADLVEEVARQPHGHAADPAEGVAGQLAVAAAFEALSEADREVLRLALWEELPARQAAKVVGCSTAAFHVRLHRARARLRHHLGLVQHGPARRASTILGGADA
ncbi:RNA polymerase sigma factor [Streptomyces spinosus]|uniref:RNA polymerase sigma factor n=1 Tax=Streptomyces spinosus TaxID=2872623 RepID=UPI0027DEF7EA|nr:RNA polymerase sigma factor [Streptomyces spinosus]